MGKYVISGAVGLVLGMGITVEALAQSPAAAPSAAQFPADPSPPAPAPAGTPPSAETPPPVLVPPPPAPAPAAATPAAPAPAEAPPPDEPSPESSAESRKGVPKARVGFQMAISTGYSHPLGNVAGAGGTPQQGDTLAMSDFTAGQVPFIFDIGGKVIPNLFIGGYLGFAFGPPGGRTADDCDAQGVSCVSASLRIGVEAQYHVLPDEPINPWFGYGLGFASTAVGTDSDTSLGFGGFEFARLMAGVDFRLTRVVGIGPFLDFSMGTFSTASIKNGANQSSVDIPETAMHEWLTLGLRVVFFP